jgi:FG-GAP repeat
MRALSLALFSLVATPLLAQEYIVVTGTKDFDGFGRSLAELGDINGDGLTDFVVGALCTDKFGNVNSGSVTAFSGLDGSQLWMINGDSPDERMGHVIKRLDDIDGDGHMDLVVGAFRDRLNGMRSGSVHVLSGLDGHRIYTIASPEIGAEYGISVDAVGDLDGDGVNDWAAGAWLSNWAGTNSGAVFFHSGSDGALLNAAFGTPGSHYGFSVAGLGDLDGDGLPECAVGAPNAMTGNLETGQVEILAGSDQSPMLILSEGLKSSFGFAVSSAGDVNGDQVPDFLVGAPESDELAARGGAAYVYSGRTGDLMLKFYGPDQGEGLGWLVQEAGDINGDSKGDFLIGSPRHPMKGRETGMLRLHSGRDGSILRSWVGASEIDKLGAAAVRISDLNGDRLDDWLIGIPQAGWNPQFEPGAAVVFLTEIRPDLRVVSLQAGGQGVIRVSQVETGHSVRLYSSIIGYGTSVLTPTAYLDIRMATLSSIETAGPNQRVAFDFALPISATGMKLYFQAVDWSLSPKLTSNVGMGVVQ